MNPKRLYQIEEISEKLLRDTKCYKVAPNVNEIAEKCNVSLIEDELGNDIYGVLVIKDNKISIGYSKNDPYVRQRFTIAHELGHLFLKHNKYGLSVDTLTKNFSDLPSVFYRNNDSSTGEKQHEIEANAFAAALLMPQELLYEEFKKDRFEEDILNILSSKFEVSTQAMAYRLSKLGLLESVPF